MKAFRLIIVMLLLAAGIKASAQGYEVPQNYELNNNADYERYEADIIKTADWLQQAPWSAQTKKLEAATQFLLKWAKGSSAVTIRLPEAIMSLSDRNPQLGFIYMAQFSKYALQHKTDFDMVAANAIALRMLAAKYVDEPTHRKDEDVEYLISTDKKGRLNDWIANAFGVEQ